MKQAVKKLIGCLLVFVLIIGLFNFFPALKNPKDFYIDAKAESGFASEIEDEGVYYIKNQHSKLYLDIANNSTSSGAGLLQYGYSGYPNQQFKVNKYSDSTGTYYTFTPMNCAYLTSPKVLEVLGNSSANDAIVQTGTKGVSTNQKFRIISTGNGDNSFVIKTGSSSYSKCITVSGASKNSGAKIIQYSYYNHGTDDNDHWYFEKTPVFNGTYYLKNQRSGKYLDIQGNKTESGTKLIQYEYNGSTNQQFKIVPYSQGGYTITPVVCDTASANTAVEIKDGTLSNRTAIQLGTKNFSNSKQRFNIIPTGNADGAFKIIAFGDKDNYKCMTVSGASSENSAEVILYDYGNDGVNDNDHWYFEDITPLNQKKLIALKTYSQKVIEFVCPDNKLYTVETFKYGAQTSDPVIAVCGLASAYYEDDNSGDGKQAKISFKGEKGRLIEIFIWSNNTAEKHCYIQLRKQKAALFGGKYNNIDTTSDLSTPASVLTGLYDCHRHYESDTEFLRLDERKMQTYNSEIMFFAGHGGVNSASFVSGGITGYDLSDMNNVKVAVWASCKSSALNTVGQSLVTYSVLKGAKAALGFNETIDNSSAKRFTDKFFEGLADGKSVSAAAAAASKLIFLDSSVKDYVIGGDGNTVVITPTGNPQTTALMNTRSAISHYDISLLTRFLSVCEYETESFADGSIRYYKTLNGYRTNQYIDLENGIITSSNYSTTNDDAPILPNVVDTKKILTDDVSLVKLQAFQRDPSVSVDSQIYYYFNDCEYIPVEVNFITYLNEERYQDIICINLNTGEEIAYESFAYLEGNEL